MRWDLNRSDSDSDSDSDSSALDLPPTLDDPCGCFLGSASNSTSTSTAPPPIACSPPALADSGAPLRRVETGDTVVRGPGDTDMRDVEALRGDHAGGVPTEEQLAAEQLAAEQEAPSKRQRKSRAPKRLLETLRDHLPAGPKWAGGAGLLGFDNVSTKWLEKKKASRRQGELDKS